MKFFAHIESFLNDEEGASGIEYALIAAMVAVVIASFSGTIQTAIRTVFTNITNALK